MVEEVATERIYFPLKGICCSSCVRRIEEGLGAADGVVSASINVALARADVEYVPARVDPGELGRILKEEACYEVGEPIAESAEVVDQEAQAREAERRELTTKVIVGAILSVPITLGSFPEFFPWVPALLQNPLLLLVLTTPVLFWCGWQFFRGAWAALQNRTSDMKYPYCHWYCCSLSL